MLHTYGGPMTSLETRFVRPPQAVLATLVSRALTEAGEATDPVDCTWVEHGSNTVVVLGERTAVRITRQPSGAADLLRTQALVDALVDLPFDLPRSTGDPIEAEGHIAIPTQRLHGVSDPPDPPDAVVLRDLLEAVHSADLARLRPHLAPPRSFFGGEHWQQVLTDRVVPLLPLDLRDDALARIQGLAALPAAPETLNHGDLGTSNVLWSAGRVSGVLDWDLAAADDPAEDVATVATSFRAWDQLSSVLDEGTMSRAGVFARIFPLAVVAFAVLGDRPPAEVTRAVARAERGLRAG